MSYRWLILLVLFLVRSTMAFQFQSVAALAPFIADSYAATLADIGLLIGLYLGPGVFIAIPGSAIAMRFGDRRVVIASLILMILGGALTSFGGGWALAAAGRVLAGVGGIAMNVTLTKMLADWFAGREIATAMGIFVNSWPVGIAVALLTLPVLAGLGGLELAGIVVLSFVALCLLLFIAIYRDPPETSASVPDDADAGFPVAALFHAGLIWALYNSALAVVFIFGPALLAQRGWELAQAASMTGVFILVASITVPFGGILADRTGRRDGVLLFSLIGCAILLVAVLVVPSWAVVMTLILMGAILGLGAGPIMSLPAQILQPRSRAMGMGTFYTIYYAVMMLTPSFAGWLSDRTGTVGASFVLGAAMLAVCVVSLALFRRASADWSIGR